MKHLLLTTIAAVLVVGCGPKAPDISIHDAVGAGNIEAIKQHLAAGTDVNAKNNLGGTPLHYAANGGRKDIAERLIGKQGYRRTANRQRCGCECEALGRWDIARLGHRSRLYRNCRPPPKIRRQDG